MITNRRRFLVVLCVFALATIPCAAKPKVSVVNLGQFVPLSINNKSEILLRDVKSRLVYISAHGIKRLIFNSVEKGVLNDHDHVMFIRRGQNNVETLLWSTGGVHAVELPTEGSGFNNRDDIMLNEDDGIYIRTRLGQTKLLVADIDKRNLIGSGINDKEDIAGLMIGPLSPHGYHVKAIACVHKKVQILADPGPEIVFPYSINNNDQIVGEYRPAHSIWKFFAIYYPKIDVKPILLDSLLPRNSGWHLDKALGINDSGEIIGIGLYHNKRAGFLLRFATKITKTRGLRRISLNRRGQPAKRRRLT